MHQNQGTSQTIATGFRRHDGAGRLYSIETRNAADATLQRHSYRHDFAVRAAYAMPGDADILAFLLDLTRAWAAREAAGEVVTPPGLPPSLGEHVELVTEDCIRVRMMSIRRLISASTQRPGPHRRPDH